MADVATGSVFQVGESVTLSVRFDTAPKGRSPTLVAGRHCGWERTGNHVRSQGRARALSCSLVREVHLRKHESAQVAGMWVHS
jgi:hypothetical protein